MEAAVANGDGVVFTTSSGVVATETSVVPMSLVVAVVITLVPMSSLIAVVVVIVVTLVPMSSVIAVVVTFGAREVITNTCKSKSDIVERSTSALCTLS